MTFEDLDYLNKKIALKRAKFEAAKVTNQQISVLQTKQDKVDDLLSKIEHYRNSIDLLLTAVINEDNNFKQRRIEYLNKIITNALTEVFPYDNLRAKIEFDFKRSKQTSLKLFHTDVTTGKEMELDPIISDGKLMQYLISFAAVSGITQALGSKNIYIDEAFGASSMDNLFKLGEILDKKVSNGVQVIMVAQNPYLYVSLPRREIHISKDPDSKSVKVDNILDYARRN